MSEIKTILYPTDLSEIAKCAFPLAYSLARDHGARLIVLHVIPVGTFTVRTLAELGQGESAEEFEGDLKQLLQAAATPDLRVPMEHKIVRGDPVTAILQVAEDTKSDLLVVGSHGRTGLRRLLMGSVAEQLMRKAPCPVLVARAELGAC
jgi:universal stress protein A